MKKRAQIPWWQPKIESEDYRFIKSALDGNYINQGPLVAQFEREIAELVGSTYAIATTNCTSAMFLALKALGIGPGDEVIVPDITFIATANAVSLCGAKPVLVDVKLSDLTIDPAAAARAITKRTKAIIPVHVSGRAADLTRVFVLAKKHRLVVIEDAAEALNSRYRGKNLGTFGVCGCFSFAANKTIATGQGGVVVTDDKAFADRIRPLINQGRTGQGTGGDDIHKTIGFNFRMTDLQATVGLGQLRHLAARCRRMKKNYELYRQQLQDIKELRVYPAATRKGQLPQWTDVCLEQRDELEKYLRERGMDCRKYWLPLHRQLAYRLPDRNFPHSTSASPRSLWLPSAFTLTDRDVIEVCGAIKEFFKR